GLPYMVGGLCLAEHFEIALAFLLCPAGHTGRLLRALLGTSILFLLAHLVFQICLYTIPTLDQLLGHNCSTWETLAQHIGVTRLDLNDIPNSVRLVAPDLGILLVSAICLGVCSRLEPASHPSESCPEQVSVDGDESKPPGAAHAPAEASPRHQARLAARLRVTAHWLLMAVGKILAIVLLALAGITLPSAFSSVYYLLFVGLCTWWACHFPVSRLAFNTLCVMVDVFAGGHLICLYGYQTPFIQSVLPPTGLWARLFGLKAIVLHVGCSKPNALLLNVSLPWPVYVNPGILLLLYYVLATLVKLRRSHFYTQVSPAGLVLLPLTLPMLMPVECPFASTVLSCFLLQPMLTSETEASGADAEDCTVHVLGETGQPGKGCTTRKKEHRKEKLLLHSLGHVIMNQSYVCALIAMMVWSITYHSWLTFVLLLWACLIWIVRSRHHFAMLCSPFILLYGIALCSLQYVWGMDLEPELPTKVGFMPLQQLGLVRYVHPCLHLGAKLLFTLTFWLLVRQFVKEKLLKKKQRPAPLVEVTVSDSGPDHKRDVLKILGAHVMAFYAKFWILVCAGMFIVVSFAGRLVVYKIVYMFLFLLCLTLFQVYYSLWRKLLKAFWWLVVAYTMLVLIAVYTFQFEDFPMYWKNFMGLTNEQLADLGLEQFSVSELFSSIFIPGFFLLACILQLHYFHRPFMRITDLEHVIPLRVDGSHALGRDVPVEEDTQLCLTAPPPVFPAAEGVPSKWGLVLERLMVLGRKFSSILGRIRVFVLRLLELHILKLVALYVVWVALQEVSVMNFVLMVLWAFAIPYCRFSHMASCLSTIWVCIIIVCKMLYQLKIVNPEDYSYNCTEPQPNNTNLQPEEIGNSTLYQHPVDPANWFGIRKQYPNLGYIQNHLQVLVLLVFEAIVYRCQEYYRKQHQLVPPVTQTVFEDATRQNLDKGLLNCIKYFVNYFYYKFGLEICFLMTVNVIGQRMNFMVIFHGCWLVVILTRRRRRAIARLWPKYCLFLAFFLLFQYLLCVGIPPVLCIDYPWRWSHAIPINSVLIKWMYFPDFYMKPNSINLMSDFLLLLCASRQWKVFVDEQTEEWVQLAGDNKEQLESLQEKPNPVPNFVNCRSYLDMLKVCVFRYLFWFVLVIVFVAGANRISIFGLGYLMACFYLLLCGTAMLRRPLRARLMLWDCLILYNVTVIVAKNMLALLSCVFVQQMQNNFCWVIQLFSLACTVKGYYDPKDVDKNQDCSLPMEEAGIIWDSICFFFLLLQRRAFLSYYFQHVVADLQASALQASRWVWKGWGKGESGTQLGRDSLWRVTSKTSHLGSWALFLHVCRVGGKQGNFLMVGSFWIPVLHSGDYFLFETDSEEDEESVLEDQKPPKQSAFQVRSWEQKQWCRKGGQGGSAPWVPCLGGDKKAPRDVLAPLPGDSNVVQRVLNVLGFLWVLCQATVDGLTQWLRAFTKEHEQLSAVLGLERFVLTQQLDQVGEVQRSVLDRLYKPAVTDNTSEDTALPGTAAESPDSMASSGCEGAEVLSNNTTGYDTRSGSEEQIPAMGFPDDVRLPPSNSQELLTYSKARPRTASELLLSRHVCFEELEESERFYHSQNRFLQLLLACYHFVAGHSDLLCYFIIILNNMVTASVISLVLPILVFLWAMLSIPRPSKRFWMTAIVYTEVMVVVKYLFQFGFFPWNSYTTLVRYESKPFFAPRILGLEKTDNYIKYDLIQLMALFFHRSLLLSYGLWDHEEEVLAKHPLEAAEPVASTESKEGAETLVEADVGAETVVDQEAEPEVPKGIRSRFRKKKEKKKKRSKALKEQGEEGRGGSALSGKWQRHQPYTLSSPPPSPSRAERMFQPLQRFFQDILHSKYRAATDVYALMFLADVVDFIIIIFGFWAFGKHSAAADITSSLSDDQVPQAFLVMLLIQFSTMVIDRALYLRKSVLGKLVFQVFLVFGIHVWMFFILPAVTERMFNLNTVAQLWYFVKCIYFALSAYQIRCGYPTRILGNFLTKKYNHLNLFLFQGFRLVPFLVELRAVMDWVWTDTTLSLSNWMCVEDIYANIFIIKCSRETEKKYPQPKGQKKKKIVKYGMGGLIILFLICIIWFPLLFMSLVRSVVGVVNHPIDVTVTLKLGGYEPLFTMSAQQQSIQEFTPKDYDALTNEFVRQPVAMQFITLYSYEDIVTARIEGSSGSLWSISPPSREQLYRELHNGSSAITLRFTWNFQRNLSIGGTAEYTSEKHTMELGQQDNVRRDLARLLQGTHNEFVKVPKLFPPYIRAPNGPEAKPVEQMLPEDEDSYWDVEVQLKRQQVGIENGSANFLEWWVIRLANCQEQDCNILPMVIFNDKVSPPSLGFLAGYGIMGLYVSIVLVIGKFVRGFFSEISHSIMFEELPCVDRILKLCHDIFLVRETGELELEEELYAKLIFLYRSPETMIKWTREKE
uniref:Piezo type mechanosensitive ion channel component 1 (Er blood group) n=1 Tax=Podarcis muralis TaxID=64176 RepID=A0A670IWS8_PODMU